MQELIIIIVIIVFLQFTGLWKIVIRGMRELRGERVEEPRPAPQEDTDICYRLLGISPSSTWDEIESAYRRKAKVHHPDRGGDEDAMRTLNEAYNKLKRVRKH